MPKKITEMREKTKQARRGKDSYDRELAAKAQTDIKAMKEGWEARKHLMLAEIAKRASLKNKMD